MVPNSVCLPLAGGLSPPFPPSAKIRMLSGVSRTALVVSLLTALSSGAALAQSAPSGASTSSGGATGAVQLAPLSVTGTPIGTGLPAPDNTTWVATEGSSGTKTRVPLTEVPQAVSVITEKELTTRGPTDLEGAVAYTAGVHADAWGQDDRFQQFVIRGFDHGQRGVYRDGLSERGLTDFTVARIDPFMLERLEVFKGSTSTLFGLNKPGGMLNATTKRPPKTALREVGLSYGSFNTKQATVDIGGPVADSAFSYRMTGLFRDGETQVDDSENNRTVFAPALSWRPADNTTVTLLAQYQKVKSLSPFGVPDSLVGRIARKTQLGDSNYDTFETEQASIGYDVDHRFNDTWALHQGARFSYIGADSLALALSSYTAATDTLDRYAFGVDGETRSVAVDTNLTHDGGHDWGNNTLRNQALLGVDYRYAAGHERTWRGSVDPVNGVAATGRGAPAGVFQAPTLSDQYVRASQSSVGLYGQNQLKLNDAWLLTLGGRYDVVRTSVSAVDYANGTSPDETISDSAFSGRAGLSYLFGNGLTPYVSYSESFDPVTVAALYGYTDVNGATLKAEPTRGRQYEIGVKYAPPSARALVTLAAYDLTQTNVLSSDPVSGRYSQTGEINIRGVELEGQAEVTDGLTVKAAYTFQHGEITKDRDTSKIGARPDLVPQHMVSGWLDYDLGTATPVLKGLTVGGGGRFVGNTVNPDANGQKATLKGYKVFDAAIHYQVQDNVKLSLTGTNLLDKEYTSTCYYGTCYYGDGRTVMSSLTLNW